MIKAIGLLTILLFSTLLVGRAQQCSQENLLARPGAWKENVNSTSGIPAADLAREKKVVASFLDMLKSNYNPFGVDILYGGAYSSPVPQISVNSYHLSIFPMEYYCENGEAKIVHETSNYFWIGANMFHDMVYTDNTDESPNLPGFFSLDQAPIKKDGCWYFEKKVTLAFGQPGISKRWLITKDNELPFSYVTKKEFLERRKRLLLNDVDGRIDNAKESLAYVEEQKMIKEKEYKNDPEKWKSYYEYIYLLDKAKSEKDMLDIHKETDRAVRAIEAQLNGVGADELGQSAIVKKDPNDYMTFLFTTEEDPFGYVLIKPNPDYFDPKLPKSVPQFIGVFITGPVNEPVSFQAINALEKGVDFDLLRGMLGKI